MFDLRAARYFIAVAEELHFGRAADRLHMSQPPLSQAIRRLEEEVGVTLLERSKRSVALTAAGAEFLPACRALIAHAAQVEEIPRLAKTGARGRITIGVIASALTWPLAPALATLRQSAPNLTVQIREIDTIQATGLLSEGAIDLALARLSVNRPGIRTRILLRDEFRALLPTGHALAEGEGPVGLADLVDDPWIWISREASPDYHDEMAAACRTAGFSPRMHHEARSIASQIAIVQTGAGVTIVPASSAALMPEGVCVRTVRPVRQTIALSASTGPRRDEVQERLIGHLRTVCATAPAPGVWVRTS